ncbi:MAG: radical SAM protein [Pelovirga sp.]
MVQTLSDNKKNRFIHQNQQDYPDIYPNLNLVQPRQATEAQRRRDELITQLTNSGGVSGCHETKPHSGDLSPGCRLCVEGSWSCLFINGRCNLSCFYCPSSQDEIGRPTTNNLSFVSADHYLAYLQHFGFRGFSLSGGEPLLTLERSLNYLATIKKHFGDNIHSWIYTNGSLVTRDILARLRDCGLDEIRFDIGALDYSLDRAILAVGQIPTVTIEIPAVPEEQLRLKTSLKQMADGGINFLNLHQLRLTNYNYRHFKKRTYSYLHGEKITVLESELTALELLNYARDEGLQLPINYCSFVYKNRYQKAAARGRGALDLGKSHEQLTPVGYLRSCSIKAAPQLLQPAIARLSSQDPSLWSSTPGGEQIFFAASLWPHICAHDCHHGVQLDYAETRVGTALSYRHPFREIKMPGGNKIAIERAQVGSFTLTPDQTRDYFAAMAIVPNGNTGYDNVILPEEIRPFEQIEQGLAPYF